MLDRVLTRALKAVRPEPPSPPPPKPKKLDALADEPRRVAATPEVQQGARARFAATGADVRDRMHDVPSASPRLPTLQREPDAGGGTPTGSVTASIRRHADAVAGADGDDARDRATIAAAEDLPRLLEGLTPAQRREVLSDEREALETIIGGIPHLDGDETKDAIAGLGRATELLGDEGAILVARPLSNSLDELVDDDLDNFGELADALAENVTEGRGALLGAALTVEVSRFGDPTLADGLATTQAEALNDVRAEYDDAREKADRLDAVLANQVQAWQGTLTPEQIQAGVDRFMDEHAEDYAARDAAAETIASTLTGAAHVATRPVSDDELLYDEDLADAATAQLETVPALTTTESGTRAIADALAARGRGETTFLDAARDAATTPEARDRFENAILRATGVRGDELARDGRLDEVPAVIRGAAGLVDDPGLRDALNAYGDDVARVASRNLPPERAARQLLSASTAALNQAPRLGVSAENLPKFAALARGIGIGAVALAGVSFANDPSVRSGLETLSAALPAGVAFTSGATRALLSKAGLAATIAFSAFDTAAALQRGDYQDAAIAAAPAAGAAIGAGVGVAFFGVGALPGAIIGGAIGTVLSVGAKLLGFGDDDDPVQDYEEDAEPFLRGALGEAGLDEDAAHRLRDVDDDLVHVGHVFPALAERLGTTPQELLARFTQLSDDEREDFVKAALDVDHNADDVREALEDDEEPPALSFDAGDLDDLASRVRDDWPALATG